MSEVLLTSLALVLCLTLLPAGVISEMAPGPDPGLSRIEEQLEYMSYGQIIEKYGIENGQPVWYKPTAPQPLNAYMTTGMDCMVGIARSGMYKVEEKGLVSDITKHLRTWAADITKASGGAIRFVSDPDQADILITASQSFASRGRYRVGTATVTGYSSNVQLMAYKLTRPVRTTTVDKTNIPGQTVTINGTGDFWMHPPEFEDSREIRVLVSTVMGWYGYSTHDGYENVYVSYAQQALIDRGYMQGEPDTVFDADMDAAVRQLQADYGLEVNGIIDRPTLLALYYDRETVEQNLAEYPVEKKE